jgi:predicted Rossmann fold flavoprotein
MTYDLIIVGGGAAGFFCAIQSAERNSSMNILILEKSKEVLSKVRISGGGRCNVTHGCFEPAELVTNYPRGNKELLGPFHRFACGDMMEWLSIHGIETSIEGDGRVFPTSNTSATIINCFMDLCKKHNIKIKTSCGVSSIASINDLWHIDTNSDTYRSRKVLVATGSSPSTWKLLKSLGHTIVNPVPSLFTFNIKHPIIEDLAGISVPDAEVFIVGQKINSSGPLLITHWGLSGPAILKLSAWGARAFYESGYHFEIRVNWIGRGSEDALQEIQSLRKTQGGRSILNQPLFSLPKRLWRKMVFQLKLDKLNFGDLKSTQIDELVAIMCQCNFTVVGKSTFKEEFVTCGGVDTREINFKTMESKHLPNLYLAGEVINIDAVTGGFNFQAAWTTGYLAAEDITKNLE